MRFFTITRRDPLAAILVALAVFIVLFMGFELFKGLHRYHGLHTAAIETQAPAGISTASLSDDGLELSGWGPAQATIQILDHDKVLAPAAVDAKGKWSASVDYEKNHRNFQTLMVSFQEKDKTSDDIGSIAVSVFAPGKSVEDAYIWLESTTGPRLLQAPAASDEGDVSLDLTWLHPNQNIIFAGRASPDSVMQLYAGGELVGTVTVAPDGYWVLTSLLKAEQKPQVLRLDEVQGQGGVVERHVYHVNWPESIDALSDETTLQQTGKNGWLLAESLKDSGHELVLVTKPEFGETDSPDDILAGQVIPMPATPQAKGIFR